MKEEILSLRMSLIYVMATRLYHFRNPTKDSTYVIKIWKVAYTTEGHYRITFKYDITSFNVSLVWHLIFSCISDPCALHE